MIVSRLGMSTFLSVTVIRFSRGSIVAEFDAFFTDEFADDATGLRSGIVDDIVTNAYYANDTMSETPTSLKLTDSESDITVQGRSTEDEEKY